MAGDAKVLQSLKQRLLQAVHIFFDEDAQTLQVDERVGHHLAWAVVGHLPAPIGLQHRNALRRDHMLGLACQALGVDRGVLAQPDFVRRALGAGLIEGTHVAFGIGVVAAAQLALDHSTTFTIGWVLSVR